MRSFSQLLVFTAISLVAALMATGAHASMDVCMKSGVLVRGARVEALQGKFVVYPEDGGTTIEIAEDQVKGIGIPCASSSPPQPQPIAQTQRFGIYGSNTIGERLMPLLIDTFSKKKVGAHAITRPREPEVSEIEVRPNNAEALAVIDFQAKGSGTSAKALLDKKAIVGMSSRRANDDEAAKIKAQYDVDLRTPGNEHVLALDGLAVIVNPENPIKRLTLDQIARIFAGEITNWKDVTLKDANGQDVTGQDRPIKVHARDNKSGTYDTFVALVLAPAGGTKRALTADAARYESSDNLSDAVAKDAGAIGFIGFPYINKNAPLSIDSTCGLTSTPNEFSVKNESYPLARRLYLYSIGTPSESVANDILQFALSDEAQATVKEAEFIDQSVDFQDRDGQKHWNDVLAAKPNLGLTSDKEVPARAARAFASTLHNVRRSTVVFRFESGKSDLDAKVVQDTERLSRYLQAPSRVGKRFVIVGFADSDGDWGSNLRLSKQRADRVASELRKHNVKVADDNVVGMSYMAPVACNDTPNGLTKNRRVEVWISD
jgi:phosphate transport system substrate-binding protein